MSIFSAKSLIVTPSVMAIGLKSSGEAGGRGNSTTLATILSGTSCFSNFFFLTNLEEGVKTLGAPGFSSRSPFRMRSVISGVTTRSVVVRIRIFVLAFGTTIFLEKTPG